MSKHTIVRTSMLVASAAFLLATLLPAAGAVSVSPFHVQPYALNNNFFYSVSTADKSGNCEVSSTSPMPPTPGGACTMTVTSLPTTINLVACTNNFRVNLIRLSGAVSSSNTVTGTKGSDTCLSISFSAATVGTYTVTAKFYAMNPNGCVSKPSCEDIKGISTGQVIVEQTTPTPVFPIGAILGVVAPLAALLGYMKLRKPSF